MRIKPSLRKASRLLAFTSVVAVALAASQVSAVAASETIDVSGTFRLNECTAETVTLDGQIHLVANTTENPDGSFHVTMHMNTQGVTGIGDFTGFEYRFNEGTNSQSEFDLIAGGMQHEVYHLEFIHPGEFGGTPVASEDDKHVHFNINVMLDPFGNPVMVPVPQYECR